MSDEVKINDQELEEVSGGRSGWDCANGSFVNYGNYIVYTVAKGDVLSGIAPRFNVTIDEIVKWNNLPNPDLIRVGQKLTIYARAIR